MSSSSRFELTTARLSFNDHLPPRAMVARANATRAAEAKKSNCLGSASERAIVIVAPTSVVASRIACPVVPVTKTVTTSSF